MRDDLVDLLSLMLLPPTKSMGPELALEDRGEDEDNLYWRLEVPGFEPGEVAVEVKNGVLTVSGKKETATEYAKGKAWRNEFRSFHNAVTLPRDTMADKVTAEQRNGVLTVTVPKNKKTLPEKESRRVEVKQLK